MESDPFSDKIAGRGVKRVWKKRGAWRMPKTMVHERTGKKALVLPVRAKMTRSLMKIWRKKGFKLGINAVDLPTPPKTAETTAVSQKDNSTQRRVKPEESASSESESDSLDPETNDSDYIPSEEETKKKPKEKMPRVAKEKMPKIEYTCEMCDVTYERKGPYNKHMARHNNVKRFECETCGTRFKYNSGLKKHRVEQHSETAPKYYCELCPFVTKHYPYLQCHFTRKHTEDYKYVCGYCNKKFKVESDYKTHVGNHEAAECVCDECGLTYPNKNSLYHHKNYKHTNKVKMFGCKLCKKRLTTEKNLEIHLLQHQQSYVCEECGMKFTTKHGLCKHRKVHLGIKSHLCTVCGRAFATITSLKVHFLTHTGDRPYLCNVCGSSYTQRSSLMLHWKKKHPDACEPPPPVTLKNVLEPVYPSVEENPEEQQVDDFHANLHRNIDVKIHENVDVRIHENEDEAKLQDKLRDVIINEDVKKIPGGDGDSEQNISATAKISVDDELK